MRRSILLVAIIILFSINSYAQENLFSRNSFKTGIGIGFNSGSRETGMGTLFAFGYQRAFWKERLRVNPNIITGGFIPFGITDTRDQYYRITSLGINGYLDALKFKSVSLFIGTGAFVNYSRGLLGTGGERQGNSSSEYFFKLYYGANVAAGIRVNPTNSRLAYELTPVNISFGNDYFLLGFMKLGVDIKLKSTAKKSNKR